jgi:BirA family biotin operon repressor/biotin-[acetyl-CoA-carboxylase] ligase
LEIRYIDRIASTQTFLENAVKGGKLTPPICLWTLDQTDGIGSGENRWHGLKGNLAFSFAIAQSALPADLPTQSASLYFGYLFKETLRYFGSRVWLKWPNDFYVREKKIGGAITKRFQEWIVCGIGLNVISPDAAFGAIDVELDAAKTLAIFLREIEKARKWGEIFSLYRLEYPLSQAYRVRTQSGVFSLEDAELEGDGSVRIGEERVFSRR